MKTLSIEYQKVKIGDFVYQSDYYAPDKWRKVTDVKTTGDTTTIKVGVSSHETFDTRLCFVGHNRQGINIKRV